MVMGDLYGDLRGPNIDEHGENRFEMGGLNGRSFILENSRNDFRRFWGFNTRILRVVEWIQDQR